MIHLLDEKSRKLRLQNRAFVQNGVATDYISVQLEDGGAFDGCDTVLMTMTRDDMQPVAVRLGDGPVEVPASLMESTGALRFSLTGYVGDEVRATTVLMKSSECGIVVASGTVSGGEVPPQDAAPDLWKQLMDEVAAATKGAEETIEKAEQAASAASAAAGQAQSAQTAAETAASTATQAASDAQDALGQLSTQVSDARESAQAAQAAQTAAETAKAAAEKAKTDAESAETAAANSASQSATSATAAAQSAASVADKFISSAQATTLEPGSQATASVEEQVLTIGVPKGDKGDKGDPGDDGYTPQRGVDYWTAEDVEAIVDDAKTQAVAELAEIGNVPKRTVTDLVAHGEDAYAQKPIEVRVKGKTWVNRWPVINRSTAEASATTDDTGLLTITTTTTTMAFIEGGKVNVAGGRKLAYAVSNAVASTNIICALWVQFNDQNNTFVQIGNDTTLTGTIDIPSDATEMTCSVAITPGQSGINVSTRVMLVDGTEAPDCFTPPASIASVETGKLVTGGKNLLPVVSQRSDTVSGVTITSNGDGSYTLNGTATADIYKYQATDTGFKLPPGTYVVSGGITDKIEVTVVKDGQCLIGTDALPSVTTTTPGDCYFYLRVRNGTTLNNVTVYPQLELGSTATPYEPPNVTTTPIPEVELRSLPNGTCDELVIRADGSCEVERKTGSYTATGEENVVFGKGQAYFKPTPTISNLLWSESISCDKLPAVRSTENTLGCSTGYDNRIFFMVPGAITDVETAKQWLAMNKPTFVYDLDEHTTEPQSPVTLPTLPAPTFNQYHDSAVPSDTSTQYARDINIVLSNLEAVQTALLGGE